MRHHGFLLSSLLTGLLGGCSTPSAHVPTAEPAAARVWPAHPAEPRVVLAGSVTMPADLGVQTTWIDRVIGLLAGGDRRREKLVRPFGVAVDEAGNLCLTDTGTNVVWFFDRARRRYTRWERIDKVRFVLPVAIAKAGGVLYVADSGLAQVLAFDESGRIRFRIEDRFVRPSGLALSDGKLFVADAGAHCIRVFDLQGRPLHQFGTRGTAPGEFNFPTHVAADSQGRIYVTDGMNSRVQIFDAAGQFFGILGSIGDGSGHFSRPKGVAVDSFGHVYVADALFDNIQIFDPEGRFLLDVGSSGSAPGEFWMPAGIAISRDNDIFVADAYNGRVQILRYIGPP